MKSLKVQSRLTVQNKRNPIRNYLNARSIIDMGVSSNLDDFFSGVFTSLGIEINGTYKISDLLKIFNEKHITVLSVCGIKCPTEINPDVREIILGNKARKKIFGNMLFSESEEIDDFYDIFNHLDDCYTITKAKILPSFTELNHNLSIKDRYTILMFGSGNDGKTLNDPIIAVELS
jgi:hypothetical protein